MLFAVAGGHAWHPQRIHEHSCRLESPIPTSKQGGIWIGFLCATSVSSAPLWLTNLQENLTTEAQGTQRSHREISTEIHSCQSHSTLTYLGFVHYREVCRQKFYTMMVLF